VLQLFLDFFIVLIVVVDPIGLAAVFAGLVHGESLAQRRALAFRGSWIAGAVLILFALIGDTLLRALGIGIAAFQIAGGLLLFLLAVDMVLVRHSGLRTLTETEDKEAERRKDIAVFPLAVPLIAGPGALTSVLLSVSQYDGNWMVVAVVLAVIIVVMLLTWIALYSASYITGFLGNTGANVITRLLGIVLAALAVQFVLNGWNSAYPPPDEPYEQTTEI
jgi:multiple antibiotic resistance protein